MASYSALLTKDIYWFLQDVETEDEIDKTINNHLAWRSFQYEVLCILDERLRELIKTDEHSKQFFQKISGIFHKVKEEDVHEEYAKFFEMYQKVIDETYEQYKQFVEAAGITPKTKEQYSDFMNVDPVSETLDHVEIEREMYVLRKYAPNARRTKEIDKEKLDPYAQMHIVISREDVFDEEKRKKLEKILQHAIERGMVEDIIVFTDVEVQDANDVENYTFTKEEFNKLMDLQRKTGIPVLIKEGFVTKEGGRKKPLGIVDGSFTLDQVRDANDKIDEVVETIRKNNFSPLEAMVYIHFYITQNFSYRYGPDQMNIMGAYAKNDIVCAGYSSLTRAIVQRLGYEGLKCNPLPVRLIHKSVGGREEIDRDGHVRCLIEVQDGKYGVDGVYTNDACWDSAYRTFAEFLRPLSDMRYYKEFRFAPGIISTEDKISKQDAYFYSTRDLEKNLDDFIGENDKGEPITYEAVVMAIHKVLYATQEPKKAQILERRILRASAQEAASGYTSEATGPFSKSACAIVKDIDPFLKLVDMSLEDHSQKEDFDESAVENGLQKPEDEAKVKV